MSTSDETEEPAGGFLGPGSSVRRSDLTDEAFLGDLSELGWKGAFKHDDPQVVQFRVRTVCAVSGAVRGAWDGWRECCSDDPANLVVSPSSLALGVRAGGSGETCGHPRH